MTPELFLELGLTPALRLLPPQMTSANAKAFIVAICLQESALAHRRQKGGGPARGYPQFERAGILGVLTHSESHNHARLLCMALDIGTKVDAVYAAIEFNDVLAAAFARLLIWTLPQALPSRGEQAEAWDQYLQAWRPGKPRPETWPRHYATAWEIVAPVYNSEGGHSE